MDSVVTVPWLLPELMVEGQMVVLAGDAGVGKSYLAMTLAQRLAVGSHILESPCAPQRVLYMNEENSYWDIREYVRWARFSMNGIDDRQLEENLRLEQMTLQQSMTKWHRELKGICTEHQPKLVIIDTATPACAIQDEDDNGEAAVAIKHLRQAMAASAPGCGMLILKHSKVVAKGEDRAIRGAKSWKGATDGLMFHTRCGGRPRVDGLHSSYLWPDKTRAFGLRERILIRPNRVTDQSGHTGISLLFSVSPVE